MLLVVDGILEFLKDSKERKSFSSDIIEYKSFTTHNKILKSIRDELTKEKLFIMSKHAVWVAKKLLIDKFVYLDQFRLSISVFCDF